MTRTTYYQSRLLAAFVSLVLAAVSAIGADEPELRAIDGRVIDGDGNPVAGANVGVYWSANGLKRSRLLQILQDKKLHGKEPDVEEMYGRQGIMEPWGERPTQTDDQGRFRLFVGSTRSWAMAIDAGQRRGGLATFPQDRLEKPVEIRLEPLVRVYGTVRVKQWEQQPEWVAVLVNLPRNDLFPLAPTRLALCGTLNRRFEFLLPAGEYVFEANSAGEPRAELIDERRIRLAAGQRAYDVGTLELIERATRPSLVEQAKARGTWRDFRKHYGQPAPRLHVTEARGVSRDVQLADFKGKWVLVYFWSPWCRPCLARGIPEVMDFQEKHAGKRDRFQILSVCIDQDNDLKTLDKLDERLAPIVRNVWRRPIEFPILLDTTFGTFQNFGIRGAGDSVLVDPDGNLAEGDLTTLATKLNQ